MNIWYKLSLLCGLAPLLLGVAILLSWIKTRASWLESAGIITIFLGLILFIFGLFFLLFYVRSESTLQQPTSKKKMMLPLSILLLNIPAGLFCVLIALDVSTSSTVTVHNGSRFEAKNILVEQRGTEPHILPSVSPGNSQTERFQFTVESDVRYSLSLNGIVQQGLLIGYVTPSIGSHVRIIIDENGIVKIDKEF